MKRTIYCLFAFMVAGFSTSAQNNILTKKPKATYTIFDMKTVSTKKVQQLYPPRFSIYSYPLEPRKSVAYYKPNERNVRALPAEYLHVAGYILNTLFADILYYSYPNNTAYWTSRY